MTVSSTVNRTVSRGDNRSVVHSSLKQQWKHKRLREICLERITQSETNPFSSNSNNSKLRIIIDDAVRRNQAGLNRRRNRVERIEEDAAMEAGNDTENTEMEICTSLHSYDNDNNSNQIHYIERCSSDDMDEEEEEVLYTITEEELTELLQEIQAELEHDRNEMQLQQGLDIVQQEQAALEQQIAEYQDWMENNNNDDGAIDNSSIEHTSQSWLDGC